MFRLIRRVLTAMTVVLAASVPSVAFAQFNLEPGAPVSAQQQRLDQLQQNVEQRFAAEGGWPAAAPSVSATAPSHDGFQWGAAGIGAAGVLLLVGGGVGASAALRRHRPSGPAIG